VAEELRVKNVLATCVEWIKLYSFSSDMNISYAAWTYRMSLAVSIILSHSLEIIADIAMVIQETFKSYLSQVYIIALLQLVD
jgi:hypothetical protein